MTAPGFIENRGQMDERVRYYLPSASVTVYFTADAIVFDLKEEEPREATPASQASICLPEHPPEPRSGTAVYLYFEDANPVSRIDARGELITKFHYFLGKDPAKWRPNVPLFSELEYRDLWPGINLTFHIVEDRLEYRIDASAVADLTQAHVRCEGASGLNSWELDEDVLENRIDMVLTAIVDSITPPGG